MSKFLHGIADKESKMALFLPAAEPTALSVQTLEIVTLEDVM